jgi:site-specific recombinase XerD
VSSGDEVRRSWVAAVEAYLATVGPGGASTSHRRIRMGLARLAAEAPAGPWQLTAAELDAWVGEQQWTRHTRQDRMSEIRGFYRWAVSSGSCRIPPVTRVALGWGLPTAEREEIQQVWAAAIDAYVGSGLARTVTTAAGRERHRTHLGWLAESSPAGPWALTSTHVEAWLAFHNWSRLTRREVLASVRCFYRWGVLEGHVRWAPLAGIQSSAQAPRRPGPTPKPLPAAWIGPVREFTTALRAGGRAEGTIRQRVWRLYLLAEIAPDPWLITTEQLAEWLSCPDWAPQTKRASRSSVRVFYRWAVGAGHLERSPAEQLDSVMCPRALPRPAPRDAIREGFAAADDMTRLALMLAGYAGLRTSEIARLHTSAIGPDQLRVVGKGGHHRVVPLHPELRSEIQAELERRRRGHTGSGWPLECVTEAGYLFPSPRVPRAALTAQHLGKLMSRALPDHWTAHTLRHYFATAAYAQQRDLRAVQELLGHAKPETTAVYAAVPDGALRSAVDGIAI